MKFRRKTAILLQAVCVFEAPLPKGGMKVCMSDYIRPIANSAPTDAKASALYAQMQMQNQQMFETEILEMQQVGYEKKDIEASRYLF